MYIEGRVEAEGVSRSFARPRRLTHLHASKSSRGVPIGSHVRTRKHTRIAMHIPGTHARIARCTPGPLERALVTPHKSIQSLRSRRTREAEWETRSVEVWAAAAICECVATAVWAGHEAPESSAAAEPKLQVLHNH